MSSSRYTGVGVANVARVGRTSIPKTKNRTIHSNAVAPAEVETSSLSVANWVNSPPSPTSCRKSRSMISSLISKLIGINKITLTTATVKRRQRGVVTPVMIDDTVTRSVRISIAKKAATMHNRAERPTAIARKPSLSAHVDSVAESRVTRLSAVSDRRSDGELSRTSSSAPTEDRRRRPGKKRSFAHRERSGGSGMSCVTRAMPSPAPLGVGGRRDPALSQLHLQSDKLRRRQLHECADLRLHLCLVPSIAQRTRTITDRTA